MLRQQDVQSLCFPPNCGGWRCCEGYVFPSTPYFHLTGAGWQAVGSKDALTAGFAEFSPEVKELVDRADENLKVWELFDMPSLPSWVRGHSALLGDAAHPFQPCELLPLQPNMA